MATRIFIDGAAGTTGLEIRDRLAGRGEFELLVLDDDRRKDEAVRKEALHEADIAILCLPDDAAREAVKLANGSGTRIIDASSAHRVADGWTYGFSEWYGYEAITNAKFVSNPGCYPTGVIALLAPLIKNGALRADWPYTVNAVSGYSGGGKALIERFETGGAPAFRTYGLDLSHKHLAEMKVHAGLNYHPVFSPSVVPAFRGMIVEIPINLEVTRADPIWIRTVWDEVYEPSEPIINTRHPRDHPNELLLEANAEPWDGMELLCFVNEETTQARLIARLDNLGKGASGAAIQNLNIMCGLPETTGLRL